MKISLKHIGWTSEKPDKFEKFWIDIMGFKKVWESELPEKLTKQLFGIPTKATCRRYERNGITIELHCFDKIYYPGADDFNFFNQGLNHICLLVDNREKFLKQMEKEGIQIHTYDNPKGHQNVFIEDFEGNWIEIYKNLGKEKICSNCGGGYITKKCPTCKT